MKVPAIPPPTVPITTPATVRTGTDKPPVKGASTNPIALPISAPADAPSPPLITQPILRLM
ncbi:hypothetical protein [Acinetobacter gerneri]|uniref:hypothetical protein n=1 Tax=Acinetobacter gerneri TaxID=202952 RepID=UPI003A8B0139